MKMALSSVFIAAAIWTNGLAMRKRAGVELAGKLSGFQQSSAEMQELGSTEVQELGSSDASYSTKGNSTKPRRVVEVAPCSGECDANLKAIGTLTPKNVLVDLIKQVAKIKWNKDVGPQLKPLALNVIGGVLTMMNPMFGAVFSVFQGLLFPSNQQQELITKILDEVESMIENSINNQRNIETAKALSGLRTKLNLMGEVGDVWLIKFPSDFSDYWVEVFKPECWDRGDTWHNDACNRWRLEGGGGAAIFDGIIFLDLMLTSGVSAAAHGAHQGEYRRNWCKFADLTKKAQDLLDQHELLYRKYREEWDHPTHGLSGGGARCWGLVRKHCVTDPFQDLITKATKCGKAKKYCVSCRGQCAAVRQCREEMQREFDQCKGNYKNELIRQLNTFRQEIDAARVAAGSLLRAGGCASQATSYYLQAAGSLCLNRGGVGGSNAYSENVGERNIGACASRVAATPGCGRWFNYGNLDGWCDCVPAIWAGAGDCHIVADSNPSIYSVYALEATCDSSSYEAMNNNGAQLPDQPIRAGSVDGCKSLCEETNGCAGFTFTYGAFKQGHKNCYLRRTWGSAVNNCGQDCCSGRVNQAR